jgi:hypothetical protein
MATMHNERPFHPNAPRRLIHAWRQFGSDRKLAAHLEINQHYVSELLWRGHEPSNEEIRTKLFLPRRPRTKREPKPEEFPGQKRIIKIIRAMHRMTTKTVTSWRNSDDKKSA